MLAPQRELDGAARAVSQGERALLGLLPTLAVNGAPRATLHGVQKRMHGVGNGCMDCVKGALGVYGRMERAMGACVVWWADVVG